MVNANPVVISDARLKRSNVAKQRKHRNRQVIKTLENAWGCRCIRRILEGKPDEFKGSYILRQKII